MSRRLVYESAMSMHPMLVADPIARDVLCRMADLAREANRGDIIATMDALAEACGRTRAVVRGAQERLLKAGLLVDRGRGDFNRRVRVLAIDENVLLDSPALGIGRVSARDDWETTEATVSPSSADREPIVSPSSADREPIVSPTRARVENSEPRTLNLEQPQEQFLSTEPAPVPERKRPPGEERLAAAVDEVMGIIDPKGQTPATIETWRHRLKTRLAAKGVTAGAIADRLQAVKAAWRFVSTNGWHAEQGRNGPAHFFTVTLRNDANVDRDAVRSPIPSTRPAVRTTRGGVRLGAPLTELDPNQW